MYMGYTGSIPSQTFQSVSITSWLMLDKNLLGIVVEFRSSSHGEKNTRHEPNRYFKIRAYLVCANIYYLVFSPFSQDYDLFSHMTYVTCTNFVHKWQPTEPTAMLRLTLDSRRDNSNFSHLYLGRVYFSFVFSSCISARYWA